MAVPGVAPGDSPGPQQPEDAALHVHPKVHDMLRIEPGENHRFVSTLTNAGTADIRIDAVRTSGADVVAYLSGIPAEEVTANSPVTLSPGASAKLWLQAKPEGGVGRYLRVVTLSTQGETPSDYTVELRGEYGDGRQQAGQDL